MPPLEDLHYSYEYWFLIAFALGALHLLTDEFFFGGACIGALITGIVLSTIGIEVAKASFNWSLPYILCGLGGLLGATLMRRACRRRQEEEPDINDEPYESDGC